MYYMLCIVKDMACVIPRKMTISQIYHASGLMYIRYDGKIEYRENGQKKTAGNRPAYSEMNKQVEYKAGSGKFLQPVDGA